MNLIDAYVTKVIGVPYKMYGKWFVNVEVDSYGVTSTSSPMFGTQEEAANIKVGSKILI
jgi:hypothetical protein